MSDKDIVVVGFPKSGSTYTARLLGDVLDSPVTGIGSAHPIAEEGLDRPGPYVVRQLHLKPDFSINSGDAIHNAWTFAPMQWKGEKIVYVRRDPRDVVVSAMHYWEIPDIKTSIIAVGEGKAPLNGVGSLPAFDKAWCNIMDYPNQPGCLSVIDYCDLVDNPVFELVIILNELYLPVPSRARLRETAERQSFSMRKAELSTSGSKYMYGADIQTKNLRKGISGDWKNHFKRSDGLLANKYFGEILYFNKYEVKPDWWRELDE